MKKIIIGIGLSLLVLGFPLFLYPAQEGHTETIKIDKWDLQSRVLAPSGQDKDSTFQGGLMNSSRWFQLNLSSSDPIDLQVSIIRHDPEEKVPIFKQTGTSFNQKVQASVTGTYWIDVQNINPTSVTLHGNILTMQEQTGYHTIYPYVLLGFPLVLAGIITLVYGISKKTKKPSKLKSKRRSGRM